MKKNKEISLNAEEREYANWYKNGLHEAIPGFCCACEYDQIYLRNQLQEEKEKLLEEVQRLIVEEINLARTTVSGKTSRLTSLMNKIYELQKKNKKEELIKVR